MSFQEYLLIILVFYNIYLTNAEYKASKYWARNDVKFKAEYVFEQFMTRNRYFCLNNCDLNVECISASWNFDEKLCLLSNVDQTNDHWKDPIPTELVVSTGWKTYSRIIFPVFHVLGSDGRYTMTFLEAKETCREKGASLATPSDLLAARSLGFSKCNCGWLADQTIGFVLQEYSGGCINWFTTDIFVCDWLSTADAWCKFI